MFLLAFPLMVTIMVGKNVADMLIHSLYHSLLTLKGVPYLDDRMDGLQDLVAADVMNQNLVVLHNIDNVGHIERILNNYTHSGFPVVKNDSYRGLLLRKELYLLLSQKHIFIDSPDDIPNTILSWKTIKALFDNKVVMKQKPKISEEDAKKYIDLTPYINTGVYSIPMDFHLRDVYCLFRTMALTHLVVVDDKHAIVGIITRKDLLGQSLLSSQTKKDSLKERVLEDSTLSPKEY